MEQKQITDQSDFRRGNLEKVGGPITLEKVRLWIDNFRRTNDRDITTSHFFGRDVLQKILDQKGCVGVRIHYAVDQRNRKQLLLSGVDAKGKDQLPNPTHRTENVDYHLENTAQPIAAGNEEYSFYDQSWPCPETKGCA